MGVIANDQWTVFTSRPGSWWHVRPLHNVSWTRTSLCKDAYTIPTIEHFSVKQKLRRKTSLSLRQPTELASSANGHGYLGRLLIRIQDTSPWWWRYAYGVYRSCPFKCRNGNKPTDIKPLMKTYSQAGTHILWVIWGAGSWFRCCTSQLL